LQPYSVFVLDVNGVATVAFAAPHWADAHLMQKEAWLRSELRAQTSKGAPIWDGAMKLRVRTANKNEIDRFASSVSGLLPEDVPLLYLAELDQ
jgi:hypothetical protein